MKVITMTLSDDEYETLRRVAIERGLTIPELVRQAIDATYGSIHEAAPEHAKLPDQWRTRSSAPHGTS